MGSFADVFVAQQSPTYDTGALYIRDDRSNLNFHTTTAIGQIIVGSGPSIYTPLSIERGLFEFDLTPIKNAAAGNPLVINSVSLSLVTVLITGAGASTEDFSLYVLGDNSDFDETLVTWDSAPDVPGGSFDDPITILSFIPRTANTTRTFESTDEFTSAVIDTLETDPSNTIRLLLKADEEIGNYLARFYTDYATNPANRPTLTVNYSVVPEPSTGLLALGAAGLLMARRRRA